MALAPELSDLPAETLQQIAENLLPQEILHLCRSNLTFQEKICDDPLFWRKISRKYIWNINFSPIMFHDGNWEIAKIANTLGPAHPLTAWLWQIVYSNSGVYQSLPFPIIGFLDYENSIETFIRLQPKVGLREIFIPEGSRARLSLDMLILPRSEELLEKNGMLHYQGHRPSLSYLTYFSLKQIRKPNWRELVMLQKMADRGHQFKREYLQEKLREYVQPAELTRLFAIPELTPIEIYTKACALLGCVGYLAFFYLPPEVALYWIIQQLQPKAGIPEMIHNYLDHLPIQAIDSDALDNSVMLARTLGNKELLAGILAYSRNEGYIMKQIYLYKQLHPLPEVSLRMEEYPIFEVVQPSSRSLQAVAKNLPQQEEFTWGEFASYFPEEYLRGRKNFLTLTQIRIAEQGLFRFLEEKSSIQVTFDKFQKEREQEWIQKKYLEILQQL